MLLKNSIVSNFFFKKGFFPFLILIFFCLPSSYAQEREKEVPQDFKNKFFIKAGISSDYDLIPSWGHSYSLGYGRNVWKNLSINIFYTHCQTNTLKGSFKYDTYPYGNIYRERNYVNRYLGITQNDYFVGVGTNGLNVHDVFGIKAAYDFSVGKHFHISPFLGVAYGWSKFSRVYIDSASFVNDKLVGGSVGFSYEQGKVFGPDMGFHFGYIFKNKHHRLFFEPELILLTTPGNSLVVSAYEAVQFSLGYNYKF